MSPNPIAEGETDTIARPEALVPVAVGAGLIERWIERDPESALKKIEVLVNLLDRLRALSIKATHPSDWLIHQSTDDTGAIIREVGYLQDCGAERAAKPWGISISSPAIEREDFPDQSYCYHMVAEARSGVTGEILEYVEGSRWSGDRFFQRGLGPDEKPDPADLRKSAYTNLHGRAVRQLAGLNAVQLDKLREAGLDISKVVRIAYAKGGKGGESTGAAVGTGDVTVAFGKSAGKPPKDLAEADLAWYLKSYGENVADPAKAKYAKANQRVLDALKAEQEKRARKGEHEEATGKADPADASSARITPADVTSFWGLAKKHAWDKPEISSLLEEIGVPAVDQIPKEGWEMVRATLERGPVKA